MIAAMIVVPTYLLFFDDDSSKDSDLIEAASDPAKAAQVLTETASDPEQGIALRFPNDWSGARSKGVVRATSEDGSTILAVTTGGKASDASQIFEGTVQGVALSLRNRKVRLIPANEQKPIAGLPTAGAAIDGRLKNGSRRSVFIGVARGRRQAYIITLYSPAGGGQLGVANLILARGLTLSS